MEVTSSTSTAKIKTKTYTYAGYWNIGTNDKELAENKVGVQIKLSKRPSLIRRLVTPIFSPIIWVDRQIVETVLTT